MIYRNKATNEYQSINKEFIDLVDPTLMEPINLIMSNGSLNVDYIMSLLPKDEFTYNEILINSFSIPYIHIKTGNIYHMKSFVVECTNGNEDVIKVLYSNKNGSLFVREITEFFKKFKRERSN